MKKNEMEMSDLDFMLNSTLSTCPEGHQFETTDMDFLFGDGCPICKLKSRNKKICIIVGLIVFIIGSIKYLL